MSNITYQLHSCKVNLFMSFTITTHYKYITAEKKGYSMQVRLYKLARYMGNWQIGKFGNQ